MLQNAVYYFGLIYLIYLLSQFLRFLHLHLRASSISKYHHGSSPWALVTGASDGIGLAIARRLASNNFNIVLHGRNPTKLDGVRTRLRAEFPTVSFRIAVAEASSPDSATEIQKVLDEVKDLHLTVLINNVGGAVRKPSYKTFENNTPDEIAGLINLNSAFPTQLTHALFPFFTRIPGPKLILNIGSLAANGAPYLAVYGGCKAFNHGWSKGLQAEVQSAGLGIEVLSIVVGGVTETANIKTPSGLIMPSATTMAKAALQKVGCGRAQVVGYWSHAVQIYVLGWLPEAAIGPVKVSVMKRGRMEEGKLE
ncbi:MAG: hypothetical protein Q9219_006909 [cf. Caloplaca sp. 3 TL-2023]